MQLPSRSSRITAIVAGGLALAVLAAPIPSANAETVVISETDLKSGGRIWNAYNSAGSEFSIDDAEMTAAAGREASDAFDDALEFSVGDQDFGDEDGEGELNGTTLASGPTPVGPLVVSRSDRAAGPYLRTVIKMRNPAAAPFNGTVAMEWNYGSDSGTKVHNTSSGDKTVRVGDRWLISADGNNFDDGDDPVVTTVLWGAGAAERPAALPERPVNGNDYLSAQFNIRIPASSTVYLVFFTELHDTPATAREAVKKYNKRPTAGMLKGLTKVQLRNTINWNL